MRKLLAVAACSMITNDASSYPVGPEVDLSEDCHRSVEEVIKARSLKQARETGQRVVVVIHDGTKPMVIPDGATEYGPTEIEAISNDPSFCENVMTYVTGSRMIVYGTIEITEPKFRDIKGN